MRVLLTLAVTSLLAAPFASAGESVLRWKLGIQPDTAKVNNAGRLAVQPEKGSKEIYWYAVYTVNNTHEEPVKLHLHARAETDASDSVFDEGYYPLALREVRAKFGDNVEDSVSLEGRELAPGETVRAVSVFQLYRPGGREFEERVDSLKVRIEGTEDPVKKSGLDFEKEKVEVWMHYEKKGDHIDPHKEPVRFVGMEEKVID